MGPHGDNGSSAAEVVFIFDLNDALFAFAILLPRSFSHVPISATSTARGWHTHDDDLHLEPAIRGELLIEI